MQSWRNPRRKFWRNPVPKSWRNAGPQSWRNIGPFFALEQTAYRKYLYCIVLYCTVLYCTVLYCTVLYCTVLYCTVLYCTVLYCTVLYCTVLYCNVLYCIVLYCIVLYCIVLYCIVLNLPIFVLPPSNSSTRLTNKTPKLLFTTIEIPTRRDAAIHTNQLCLESFFISESVRVTLTIVSAIFQVRVLSAHGKQGQKYQLGIIRDYI